jgi:hypothetical protein
MLRELGAIGDAGGARDPESISIFETLARRGHSRYL